MRIPLISFLVLFAISAPAQQSVLTSLSSDKYDYLHKSRDQKTIATVCLVTGLATTAVGAYVWILAPIAGLSETGNVDGAVRTGRTMVIAGSSLTLVSIPLFSASRRNKNKAALCSGTSFIKFPLRGSATQLTMGIHIPICK